MHERELLTHEKFVNSAALKQLSEKSNTRTLESSTEEELAKLDTLVQKMMKGMAMSGDVVHQTSLLDIDCAAYAHGLGEKIDSVKETFELYFDAIAKLVNSNMKNPYRDEPVAETKAAKSLGQGMQLLGPMGFSNTQLVGIAKGEDKAVGTEIRPKDRTKKITFLIQSIDEDSGEVSLQENRISARRSSSRSKR